MAEKQASGLKNYLSADDIDNPRFKSPGKLSSNLLGQFDSQPNLASTNKPNKRLSRSSPHLLQANPTSVRENYLGSDDNSKTKIDAGGQMTSEPQVCSLPSCKENDLSKSEMVEVKEKKRRKRWKWSPWKKMRKIFGRKKGKRAQSCENLPVTTGHPSYKTTEGDSHGDSLRKRTKSEPTLSDARARKIGLAVADVHSRLAAGGGGALVKGLKKHHPEGGTPELVTDPSEETAASWPPTNLQWITTQPSAEEASVSFEETPPSLALVGLQSAHDKIKAAPKNRRPPTRMNSGGSGGKKLAPMKPHRKSKTDPSQGGRIKSESDSIGGLGSGLSLTDRNSRVVLESLETKGVKDEKQEKNGPKVERSNEKNIGSDVKVDERTKGKPLLPPVLKPLHSLESEKVSEFILKSSETEKASSGGKKSSEIDVALEPEDKSEESNSRKDVLNSVKDRANQILSAAPGSPKLGTKSSKESPKPSPRSGIPLKPTPQSRQKWREEKDKVSEACDDAFDLLETEKPVAKSKDEKVSLSEAAVISKQEEKASEATVNLPKSVKGSETAFNSAKDNQGFEKIANASKDEDISQTANRPRPAPRPSIPIKPKSAKNLHDDKKDVSDALEDAFSALEPEKTNPEMKQKESKSSGSPTAAPRRAVAPKPVPKSRQKLRGEKSNGEQTKKTYITENAKGHGDKNGINTANGQEEKPEVEIAHLSNGKVNNKEHSSHMPVLRSKSDSQVKVISDSGIKERAVILSSIDSDQRTDISPGVSLKPVKTKEYEAKKEKENSSPTWLTKGVQLRNQQFLMRDTDNRKTCPPKLLASLKLTGRESKEGGEQDPPWVALANKKTKRLSQILEPEKDSPPSVQPKPNSKPSVLAKPSSKTTNFTPSLTTTENRGSLSRSKSVGQTVLEKEKSKSLTRASSEDKPSPFDKQGKHDFLSPKLEKCVVCSRTVYQTERCNFDNSVLHRGCIRCTVCKRSLVVGNFVMSENKIYCKNHVQQTVAPC